MISSIYRSDYQSAYQSVYQSEPVPFLDLSLLRARQATMETRSFRRGHRIVNLSGNWVIESGVIRMVTWDMDGNTSVLGLWGIGESIHQVPRRLEPCEYECLAPTILVRLSDVIDSSEVWTKQYLKMEELLALANCRHVGDRLLKTLHWLAHHFGIPHCEGLTPGRLIDIQMTHQQLADLAGTTRVTVTRCLGQFERADQIIRLRRGRFLIPE